MAKKTKILRVGFDLDGVILYNPVRIIRPLIYIFKKLFLKKRLKKFWIPEKPWEKWLWSLAHKSSIFISPGFEDIKKLVKEKKIKAYIVTSRFSFLKNDFQSWLEKIDADEYFSGAFFNEKNEQPHLFKEKIIQKLKLDIFVEDNWNIVEHLNNKYKGKIYWIYNLFDKTISYQYKFPSLKKTVTFIHNKLKK